MPEIGTIIKASEFGHKCGNKYVWLPCQVCGKERWVMLRKGRPEYNNCLKCGPKGEKHPLWKGGQPFISGYKAIRLEPDDFFFSMTTSGHYILEHRLVMAKHLRRCLHSWEVVHHKNGDISDNSLSNLALVTIGYHNKIHFTGRKRCQRADSLKER